MNDQEHSAKHEGLQSDHQAASNYVDTRQEVLGAAIGAEQSVSDVGSLGVGHTGDLADVDPLAIGLNDESSALGEVITEVMDDNHAEGAQGSPSQ
jgi:hypothetical protein